LKPVYFCGLAFLLVYKFQGGWLWTIYRALLANLSVIGVLADSFINFINRFVRKNVQLAGLLFLEMAKGAKPRRKGAKPYQKRASQYEKRA
jgi:hypothetical protein